MAVAVLLDGKTGVSAKSLAGNMISAALLANAAAGCIDLIVENNEETAARSLLAIPTGKTVAWPSKSLESRLTLDRKANVKDIVKEWIISESQDSWSRAIEQGKIMLVLRGFAVLRKNKWFRRTYLLADKHLLTSTQAAAAYATELLSRYREQRPDLWNLLEKEISTAMADLTLNKETHRSEHDPWLAELQEDVEKYKVSSNTFSQAAKSFWNFTIGLLLFFILFFWAYEAKAIQATLGIYVAVLVLLSLLSSNIKYFKNYRLRRMERFKNSPRKLRLLALANPDNKSIWTIIFETFLSGSILALVIAGIYLLFKNNSVSVFPILVILAVAGYMLVTKKVAKAINTKVTGIETNPAIPINIVPGLPKSEETSSAKIEAVEGSLQKANNILPVEIEIITLNTLPPVSDESRKRVEDVKQRSPIIRRVYQQGIYFLSVTNFLLLVIHHSYLYFSTYPQRPLTNFITAFVIFQMISLFFTLIWVRRKSRPFNFRSAFIKPAFAFIKNMIAITEMEDWSEREKNADDRPSIRLRRRALIGVFWIIIMLINLNLYYTSLKGFPKFILCLFSVIIIAGYLYWIQTKRRLVEKQIPYRLPFNLLALRVFGSTHLSNFLELTKTWQFIGTRQRLDGPDTVGQKASDIINYFSGRLEKSIVKNEQELQSGLKQFKSRPDHQLRFPENSLQCNNATWKVALQHLIFKADVIVLDLSGLSEKNQGVAYEISKLLNEVPLSQILMLVDDSTEMPVLKKILEKEWQNMSEQSPNRLKNYGKIRLFDTGGMPVRKENETLYDWTRRRRNRLQGDQLVAMLLDAATVSVNAIEPDAARDAPFIYWTGLGFSNRKRRAWNIILVMLLVLILYAIIN